MRGLWQLNWRRQVALVFVAAFLVRFGHVCFSGQLTRTPLDYSEQVRIARHLVHGTGFVSPVGPERDDPSSWYAPGYIACLAAVYWMFGENTHTSLIVARVLGLLALSGAISTCVVLTRRLLGRRPAVLSAVLLISSPAISAMSSHLWDTFPCMLGGALCLALFVFAALSRWWTQALAGAACGAVALVNPCFTTCYPVWVIWNRWYWGRDLPFARRYVFPALWVLIGFGVVIAPWTIRNRVVFGEWFYLRGNLGLEMWVGNAPWSNGTLTEVDGRWLHPVFHPKEEARLIERGEFNYFQDRLAEARGWLVEEPGRVAGLTLRRVRWFWLGLFDDKVSRTRNALKFVGYTIPGVLAWGGAVLVLIRRRAAWVLVATLAVFPLPYYLTVVMVRYRTPVEPVVLVLAAFLLSELAASLSHLRNHSTANLYGPPNAI